LIVPSAHEETPGQGGQDRVGGRALWALTVDDDDLPSRWVVVDREFQPAV
jgi:hypothetical protein